MESFGADPRRVDYAGADVKEIDYGQMYHAQTDALKARYGFLKTECKIQTENDYVGGTSYCCSPTNLLSGNRSAGESGAMEMPEYEKSIFFYHPDHLGSTTIITNFEGEITQSVAYVPYGEVFIEERSGVWNTPYLFNAKELDEETGLYYYGARYLDPTLSLWQSVDPLFEKYAGMSPYNYCTGNPVVMVDVDGREEKESDAAPSPCPQDKLGTPDYYLFRIEDYEKRTGEKYPDDGYSRNYGFKYATKFKELKEDLSQKGKKWVDETMLYLQEAIEKEVVANANVELEHNHSQFRKFAFESHADCYKRAGVALLSWSDLIKIGLTPIPDVMKPVQDPAAPGCVYLDLDADGISQMVNVGLHVLGVKYWNNEVDRFNNNVYGSPFSPNSTKLQPITNQDLRSFYGFTK